LINGFNITSLSTADSNTQQAGKQRVRDFKVRLTPA
jgi:hypothetical protein